MMFIGFDVAFISSKIIKYSYTLPKNRREEFEADTLGMFLMARAGFNPEEMINAFENLHKNEKLVYEDIEDWKTT